MSAFHDVILVGASGSQGYQISRSVRTRQSASAYFNRTAGVSPTSNQKGTFSFWIKRGLISYGTEQWLFAAGSSSLGCYFRTDDKLGIEYFGGSYLISTQVFRDPSAWYHIVFAVDSTQATSSNRAKLYVNGVQVTSFGTEQYPTQNATFNWMASGQACYINQIYIGGRYFDGYHTEFNYIDGQQLTPSSFGETDAVTGVWKPKKYAGTYGTNGFYLNFSDNSNNTAATIGKDYSGNGNNWTPNNISVTSGVTYDSMLDVPTPYADGGNGRGNYATLNPTYSGSTGISDGNLTHSRSAASWNNVAGSIYVTSGKWYFEVTKVGSGGGTDYTMVGVANNSAVSSESYTSPSNSWTYLSNGNKYGNGTNTAYGATFTGGDVIGVALDMDAGTITFYKNNTSQGTAFTGLTGQLAPWVGNFANSGTSSAQCNFGQRPFAYTPPTGFKALNTQNLPDSTIKKGNQYFNAVTWTGDGVDGRTITGVGFNPDLVWAKGRSNTGAHVLADAVRGTNANLYTNLTDAETNPTTGASGGGIGSVTTDGFVLEQGSTNMDLVNTSSRTYVAWQWKESATAGFDIVTFTNPSSGSSSFAHNLGVKPSMIIVKSRSNTSNWTTMHKSLGTNMADNWINLESTAAKQTSTNIWGGEPTSSVFYCGTGIQVAGATMVAYLFSEVAGFSRMGSFTGNGSSDGSFVYLGFRPRFVLVKASSAVENWLILDSSTGAYNVISNTLLPNSSGAEATGNDRVDFLSNGFKCRASGGVSPNASGVTYIYAAFAENPTKYSLAR